MTKNFTYSEKHAGDQLTHTEWNNLAQDVDAAVDAINNGAGGGSGNDMSSYFYMNNKGNLCIETTAENTPSGKKGKLNIESNDDIQIKPGDDVAFYSHHRAEGDRDAIMVKVLTESNDEDEIPAQLKINSGDITLTSKDNVGAFMLEIKSTYKKTPDFVIDADFPANTFINGYIYKATDLMSTFSSLISTINVLEGDGTTTSSWATLIVSFNNAGVNKTRVIKYTDGSTTNFYKFTRISDNPGITNINIEGDSGKGYLKVRAQAIDLRCEDHGGIALQPKGEDGQGHMNKIKFEHGGGDGLEFGTFNTEHTSLFTGDYRFNKNGVIKLATRTTIASDKADVSDSTTAYKYVKAADDFYDNIDANDPTCTWGDIVTYIAWAKTNNQGPWASQS